MYNFMEHARNISHARQALVEAQIALREAKHGRDLDVEVTEARHQKQLTGKDAAARKIELAAAVAQDMACCEANYRVMWAESDVDRAQMRLDAALEDRRAAEWSVRQAFVVAMASRSTDDIIAIASVLQENVEDATDAAMDDLPF